MRYSFTVDFLDNIPNVQFGVVMSKLTCEDTGVILKQKNFANRPKTNAENIDSELQFILSKWVEKEKATTKKGSGSTQRKKPEGTTQKKNSNTVIVKNDADEG